MSQALTTVARLRKEGRLSEALVLLRETLRSGTLDASGYERAGRLLAKAMPLEPSPLHVRILGQCTTSWLLPVFTAVAWGADLPLLVTEADYDNVLQDLDEHARSGVGKTTDLWIFVPWSARILAQDTGSQADRMERELAFWSSAWERCQGSRVIQVGYDWMGPGPEGLLLASSSTGRISLIRQLNQALAARLPPGAVFLDLDQLSGTLGRERFYDARRYHWTKQPFSEEGALRLSRALHAATRALLTGPKKVLVLDLDNTLWGGVVGELGPQGVELGESPAGEAFRAFQRYVKGLSERGILLTVASKNNPSDARDVFEQNTDCVLRLGDFAAFEANWEPKARSLVRISERLRLGLDSFVFFDDNPAEREHIRKALPMVEVVEVPEDPSDYARALEASLLFEAAHLTREDTARSAQYQAEALRSQAASAFASLDEYLASLEMHADLRAVEEIDRARVVQLLAKTNQFNLTTRRHDEAWVQSRISDPACVFLSLRVRDRFGDHGLVALLCGVPQGPELIRVDTFLMSCRVIGRTVEHHLWGAFLVRARALGYRRVQGEYISTAKNAQVHDLYPALGLKAVARSDELHPGQESPFESTLFEADIDDIPSPASFLR